jgi:hypothetical protein
MLPVSAWPPQAPGSALSPFGAPRTVNVGSCGYVLPKGAWIVQTGSNRVVMFRPDWRKELYGQPRHQPGTGKLPGQGLTPPSPCPPKPTCVRPTHDQYLEAWRAWQRKSGQTNGPIRPLPGRVPPNFNGWRFVNAPASTLVQNGQAGTVLADGQNVVIMGSGCATITQAFSV